jgi:hypothetical protein
MFTTHCLGQSTVMKRIMLHNCIMQLRKTDSPENAKNDKIENVAGTV